MEPMEPLWPAHRPQQRVIFFSSAATSRSIRIHLTMNSGSLEPNEWREPVLLNNAIHYSTLPDSPLYTLLLYSLPLSRSLCVCVCFCSLSYIYSYRGFSFLEFLASSFSLPSPFHTECCHTQFRTPSFYLYISLLSLSFLTF